MLREDDAAGGLRGPGAALRGPGTAAGRRRPARAGGAVPVGGRRRHARRRRRHRRAARHHRPGRVPHRAGGADQRGQARARGADRDPADRLPGRGDADRGQPGRRQAAARLRTQPGLGLVSMRERAEALGGRCEAGPAAAAGWCAPRSRSPGRRRDPGPARRRPGTGPDRAAGHPARAVRLRGGGRVRRRRRGRRRGRGGRARRGADGRPDAVHRRRAGHPRLQAAARTARRCWP